MKAKDTTKRLGGKRLGGSFPAEEGVGGEGGGDPVAEFTEVDLER